VTEKKSNSRAAISRESLVESAKILALATGAAIAYGIAMDQITIRVCPEYFTVAHPHILNTGSLTLLALAWGVVATWWVGAIAGMVFAFAACVGSPAKLTWRHFARPVLVLLMAMAACAVAAGFAGDWMTSTGQIPAVQAWGSLLPMEKHGAFMADLFAHAMSYFVGAVGAVIIALAAAWRRFASNA
jgi:energy-coupling factor transporter transmembrane protein EcfT